MSVAGVALWSIAKSNTSRSIFSVDTPGRTSPVSMSRHSAASRPALRMPSKASGPCSLICPVRRVGASEASTKAIVMFANSAPESASGLPARVVVRADPGLLQLDLLERHHQRQHAEGKDQRHAAEADHRAAVGDRRE